MPFTVTLSTPQRLQDVEPLSPDNFVPFGTVIQNPQPLASGSSHQRSPSQSVTLSGLRPSNTNAVVANQGTAVKYADISQTISHYDVAPSRKPANLVMSMFVCSPRELLPSTSTSTSGRMQGFFPVKILERHPFTSQTFI